MKRNSWNDGWVGTVQVWIAVLAAIFLILPLLVVYPMAFSTAQSLEFPPPGYSLDLFKRLIADEQWMSSIRLSLIVGVMAALIASVFAVPVSYAIVRIDFSGKRALYAMLLAPLVVSNIIIALSLFLAFAGAGLVGNVIALAFAHALVAMPYVVVLTTAVLRDFDVRLEHAARSLGGSPIKTFFFVTLPGIRSGVLLGAFIAFAISFDEIILTLFLGGRTANTLPRQIWSGLTTSLDPIIAAVSAMLVTIVFLIFALVWVRQFLADRVRRNAMAPTS